MPHCRRPVPRSLPLTTLFAGLVGLALIALAPVSGASTIERVAHFNGSNGGGSWPNASLPDAGGTLYGVTNFGGTAGSGVLFSYDPLSGSLTTLASFNESNSSAYPYAEMTDVGGTLYGTTTSGGTAGDGRSSPISCRLRRQGCSSSALWHCRVPALLAWAW